MMPPPDLSRLTEAEKDTLILALWAQVQALTARVAHLEARLNEPTRTSSNSSLPPSKGHKANRPERERRAGPRRGSLGRAGGGRPLAEEPDQFVIAKAAACAHCRAALGEADQRLHARYDKVELPPVRPVVTRVERYLGRCPCCGGATLAPVPEGVEEGSPLRLSILALAPYLRFTHAISYRPLIRPLLRPFSLPGSQGPLDSLFPPPLPTRNRLRPAARAFPPPLRVAVQRRRLGGPVPPRQAAVRGRGRRHPRPPAPRPGGLLRRDHGAGRRPDLLGLGVPERRGGDPRHPAEPRPGGGGGGAGRAPAGDLGVRPPRRPARARRPVAGLPGAPVARPAPRRRGGRRRLRPAAEGAPAAGGRARPAPPRAQGRHPTGIPPPPGTGAGPGPGPAAEPPPRSAAAPALPRGARQPVHLPRASRRAAGQRRQRARPAADGGVPQGHRRLPLGLGAGPVRRGRVGGRHRRPARHGCLPRHPCRPIRPDRTRPRLSSYAGSTCS